MNVHRGSGTISYIQHRYFLLEMSIAELEELWFSGPQLDLSFEFRYVPILYVYHSLHLI